LKIKQLGRHLLIEFIGCDPKLLNNLRAIKRMCRQAVLESGATIVGDRFHKFAPHGVSGVFLLAESHFSFHSWPEYGYAAVDVFTCGEKVDPEKTRIYLKRELKARRAFIRRVKRGIPSEKNGVIPHK
jgi:S-adenosylmethionine decarboxylase